MIEEVDIRLSDWFQIKVLSRSIRL